jgi:hypothetical protein
MNVERNAELLRPTLQHLGFPGPIGVVEQYRASGEEMLSKLRQ